MTPFKFALESFEALGLPCQRQSRRSLPKGRKQVQGPPSGPGTFAVPGVDSDGPLPGVATAFEGGPLLPGLLSNLVGYDGCPLQGTRWEGASRLGKGSRSGRGKFAFPGKGEVEEGAPLKGPRCARSSFLEVEEVVLFLFVFVFLLIETGFLLLGLKISQAW